MKTCKDCFNFSMCDEPYTEDEIQEYTTGDIRTLCMIFKDKADYVEPVRCKECIHYMPKTSRCWRMCFPMTADDYCSLGEKKVKNG